MADLNAFAKSMRETGRRVEVNASLETRRVAAVVQQVLILGTPVDTGRARANWDVGLGTPVRVETEDTDKSGAATIARNQSKISLRRPGQDIFISNNLPYINRLNEGSSSQAPAGFVELAVATGVSAVKRSRLLKG